MSRCLHLRLLAASVALAASACADGGARGPQDPAPVVEPAGYLGPTLALDAPSPGAMLALAGPVALAGRACDPVHALSGATLGGAPVALAPAAAGSACRAFGAEFSPRAGLNVVRGEVVNDAGERGTLARAFLAAPAYFDPEGEGAASGLVLQAGQAFLDDGDRTTLDDVASLVEAVVHGRDLDADVGEVRFASPDANGDGHIDTVSHDCVFWTQRNKRTGFEAWKSGALTHGGVFVEALTLEDGGLSARLAIRGVRVPFGVTGNLDSGCLGDAQKTVHGDVTAAAITVEAHAAVGLDATGQPAVTFTSTTATLTNLDIDIALGVLVDWTGLGSLIGDAIEASVRGQIQAALRDGVKDALGTQIAAVLPALAAFGGELTLPAELGGGSLRLESGLDLLELTAEHLVLGTRVKVRAAEPGPAHPGAPGAMRLGGEPPDPATLGGDTLALAIGDDVLNQLLHAAWRAGALDLADLGPLLPVEGVGPGTRVALSAGLPPVVMPRRDGAPGVEVGWGEVGFDIALAGERGSASLRGRLSLSVGLERLEADGEGGLRPVFAPEAEVDVEVSDVDWDHLPTTRKLTEGLVRSLLANALPDLLGQAIRPFRLPALDLGALDPSLSGLSLRIEPSRAERAGSYHVVAGGAREGP
jgi:hypothetical protein